jgi:hypothetical protein
MAANGAWPWAVARTCAIRLQLTLLPATKRSLPSLSMRIASSSVADFCRSLVKTAHSSAAAHLREVREALRAPELKAKLRTTDIEVMATTAAEAKALLKAEAELMARVVKATGMRVN